MNIKVHYQDSDSEFISKLRSRLNSSILLTHGELPSGQSDYEILIAGVPNQEQIIASPNLKAVIIPWAGLPKATRALMKKHPNITVHNIHHNAAPVAEHAITLMMTAAKRINEIDHNFRNSDWSFRYNTDGGILLEGKNVLILGYGTIGKRIDNICSSFEMNVKAIKNNITEPSDNLFKLDKLDNLLSETNILFVCLPLTDKTDNLIGADQLSLLPENSIVINISRGSIINESALYNILKGGKIYAGLDVWYNYPKSVQERKNSPPSEFPFQELKNVVMTPHMAGHSHQTEELRIEHLASLLNKQIDTGLLDNQIDLKRGY